NHLRPTLPTRRSSDLLGRHKWLIAKGAAAAVILAGISAGGNRYIEKHTYEIYHVYLNGQVVGAVNDASIVGKAVQDRFAEIAARSEEHTSELQSRENL